ncbi:MAG: hypothetical protein PVI06_14480 [Desulfobacterales bacterium]|jgi:hypothetical protein
MIKIETISKPREEYSSAECSKLSLPVAPAIIVGKEILVEGSDVSDEKLKEVICGHHGLYAPQS